MRYGDSPESPIVFSACSSILPGYRSRRIPPIHVQSAASELSVPVSLVSRVPEVLLTSAWTLRPCEAYCEAPPYRLSRNADDICAHYQCLRPHAPLRRRGRGLPPDKQAQEGVCAYAGSARAWRGHEGRGVCFGRRGMTLLWGFPFFEGGRDFLPLNSADACRRVSGFTLASAAAASSDWPERNTSMAFSRLRILQRSCR